MVMAYFDCFSGVSGDMVLGALIDAGIPIAHLKRQLSLLPLAGYSLRAPKDKRQISGTNVRVIVKSEPKFDSYPALDSMIAKSRLPKGTKELARAIFERLAKAEAKVHGIPVGRVHFHEVGATDSIVDVVGAAIGFEYFGFESIHASPIPISRGKVKCMHGMMPVPAPATLEILKGIPLEASKIKGEIVTPTGAAIIATVVSHFGECPLQKIKNVGYGFGDKVIPGIPNALRLMIGEGFPVVVVQTDIDDMNPQLFGHVAQRLFKKGAVDVDLASIQMKKGRPAIRITALVPWKDKDAVIDALLTETTTFGVRYWPVERKVLARELVQKKVRGKNVNFKLGLDSSGKVIKAMPEYEDMLRLSRKTRRPLIELYQEASSIAKKFK